MTSNSTSSKHIAEIFSLSHVPTQPANKTNFHKNNDIKSTRNPLISLKLEPSVLLLYHKHLISRWMVGEIHRLGLQKDIKSRIVRDFPHFFQNLGLREPPESKKAWDERDAFITNTSTREQQSPNMLSSSRMARNGKKRTLIKTSPGRGHKMERWKVELQRNLFNRV